MDSEWVWVLDPIDGTFNYAAGSPMRRSAGAAVPGDSGRGF
jgi:hypothetical protein